MYKTIVAVVILIIALVTGLQSVYVVDETEIVVITRFGSIQTVRTAPGLDFKTPFIDQVNVLDGRLLRVDVAPAGFPDIENQFLDIDAYVRYRIVDARSFRETLVDEIRASGRISNIVVAALREEVGQRLREEIIGGRIDSRPDGTRAVEPILDGGLAARETLTRRVRANADEQAKSQAMGIEIVDVRIKRADFPPSIVESVYTRMRSERDVQAQRLRAEGEQEFLTKTADVNRRVLVIEAEADRESDTLRGEGEGEAIRILAEALDQNRSLFAFRRSLEAYAVFMGANTTVVLSADSPLFEFLQSPGEAE
jgi:membrane protease subunit HflC